MSKKFTRKIENFVCENCGANVTGDGYTNHCPECLWSKHVDINPGDREETCGGMMKPIGVIALGGEYTLIQQCQKCGFERKNKVNSKDNFQKVLEMQ